MAAEMMIERVARALAFQYTRHEDNWQEWREDAMAAIEAMREPTSAMIDGCDLGDYDGWNVGNSAALARLFWISMIDEALK